MLFLAIEVAVLFPTFIVFTFDQLLLQRVFLVQLRLKGGEVAIHVLNYFRRKVLEDLFFDSSQYEGQDLSVQSLDGQSAFLSHGRVLGVNSTG